MNRELARQAMELAGRLALRAFRGRFDREELVADAKSLAWQQARNTKNDRATPSTIAGFAIKQVTVNRQFQWSIRTVDHPRNWEHITRQSLNANEHCKTGGDPARIAEVKIDVADWLDQLSPQQFQVASLFAGGFGTGEIAQLLRKTPGRISQVRDELRENWDAFHGEG